VLRDLALFVITRLLRARPDVARERRPIGFPRSLRSMLSPP